MNSPSEARLLLRLPAELKTRVEESARENCRRLNREIEYALRQHVAAKPEPEQNAR
jgi:hypothetical protein